MTKQTPLYGAVTKVRLIASYDRAKLMCLVGEQWEVFERASDCSAPPQWYPLVENQLHHSNVTGPY